MALVAYDNSDSSEFEDDDDANTTSNVLKNPVASEAHVPGPSKPVIIDASESTPNLFNLLPQPSRTKPVPVEEEDDEFLHKKETVANLVKPKARITVPSLNDFKDVEDSLPNKPKQPSGKKSGLLSMLPQPRNGVISTTTSKSLVPNVLKHLKPVEKKKPLSSANLKKETKSLALDYSDDSDNDEVQNDFFSMNKPEEPIPEIAIEEPATPVSKTAKSSAPNQKLPASIESYFKKSPEHVDLQPESTEYPEQVPSYSTYAQEEQSFSEVPLDDEALVALCGSRGARRRREDIQVLHVDQREVLAEARQLLAKGLMDDTTKRVSSSKRRGDEPSAQQRKKHQITYLAHQAKANEAELQNQWANGRMSRKQTQSKYGF